MHLLYRRYLQMYAEPCWEGMRESSPPTLASAPILGQCENIASRRVVEKAGPTLRGETHIKGYDVI